MRAAPPHIRCVLFDLGSTLWYKVETLVWQQLAATAQAKAITILRESSICPTALPMDDAALGTALQTMIENQIDASHRVMPDEEPDFNTIAMRALLALGVPGADRKLGARVYEALRVRAHGSRLLFADSLTTLAVLHERGYTLGVVTNRHYGGDPFIQDLQELGLLAFFDARYLAISADLRYRKPHPSIFQYAMDGAGVPATESAMVGDNLLADIWGAQHLGIFTVWKPKTSLRSTAQLCWEARSILDGIDPAWYPTKEDFLFAWAHAKRERYEPRVLGMAPPDATIDRVDELLEIFPGL